MTDQSVTTARQVELVTFHVGQALCGLDILTVQEISKILQWTPVPQASEYVMGIRSLRGEIVTVVDLGRILSQQHSRLDANSRIIVVNSLDEHIALVVDRIQNVVSCSADGIYPPPANVNGIQAAYISGVLDTGQSIVSILNVEEILSENHF